MMIKKLQAALKAAERFDGALILSPENRFYFTGFASSDGFLLVSADRAVFITDGRYIEAAQNQIQDCEVVLQQSAGKQLAKIFTDMGVSAAAVETERISVADFAKYGTFLKPVEAVPDSLLDEMICNLRTVKTPQEIAKMKAAQRIAEAAFDHILNFIKPGKTEKEIALELDFFMLSHGAEALSFETIAVSGKKSSMPHGVPDCNTVQRGDFITMDFGAVVDGYHSDMTRTVAVGAVSERQKEVYSTVLRAQEAVLTALKPGLACKAADKIARDVITEAGYGAYFTHSTGHGVGVEIHEFPRLSARSADTLEIGEVVTDEPGIYIPGEFGVRIEDMALITPDGCENLTKCPKELIIL